MKIRSFAIGALLALVIASPAAAAVSVDDGACSVTITNPNPAAVYVDLYGGPPGVGPDAVSTFDVTGGSITFDESWYMLSSGRYRAVWGDGQVDTFTLKCDDKAFIRDPGAKPKPEPKPHPKPKPEHKPAVATERAVQPAFAPLHHAEYLKLASALLTIMQGTLHPTFVGGWRAS